MMQDSEKTEIYEQAKLLAEVNTEENLEKAMKLFQSISGWRDANRQYINCRTQLGRMKWQKESVILKEYEEKNEEQLRHRRKIVWASVISVLLIIALISTIALVRFHRYNVAAAYYVAGEYERAADAFMKMANYRDAKARVYWSAVDLYRQKMYEKALPYFVWLDGYMDNGYYLKKCQEKLNLITAQ